MKYGPHILIYGDAGTWKSSFAATLIGTAEQRLKFGDSEEDALKPVLVCAFDPAGKLNPYRARGTITKRTNSEREEVEDAEAHTLAVIERYHEKHGAASKGVTMQGGQQLGFTPTGSATQYELFIQRMRSFLENDEQKNYYALVIDSTTFMELAIRSYLSERMKVLDNKMIWAQATDELERFLMFILPDLDITTVVICHTNADYETTETGQAHHPRLPGRLGKDVLAAFDEVYHPIPFKNEDGTFSFKLQTRNANGWRCASQLGVPDPMEPHWGYVRTAKNLKKVS